MSGKNRAMYLDASSIYKRECEIPEPAQDEVLIKIAANGMWFGYPFLFRRQVSNFVVSKPISRT